MDLTTKNELDAGIEACICELPLYEYAFINVNEIEINDKVRYICETQCPMYAHSYSCPPAMGSIIECSETLQKYKRALFFTSIAENVDTGDFGAMLSTRNNHSNIVRKVREIIRNYSQETLALASESCSICEKCAYPCSACRHPEKMLPCIESYGILVSTLAEKCGMSYSFGSNTVVWFGMVLYD